MVLDSVSSPMTTHAYNMALEEFLAWFRRAPRPKRRTKAYWPGTGRRNRSCEEREVRRRPHWTATATWNNGGREPILVPYSRSWHSTFSELPGGVRIGSRTALNGGLSMDQAAADQVYR